MKKMTKNVLMMALMLCFAAGIALAADNSGKWTKAQVERYCYGQAKGNADHFVDCLERKSGKIGRDKQPGEAAALNQVDDQLNKKAKARAAKK